MARLRRVCAPNSAGESPLTKRLLIVPGDVSICGNSLLHLRRFLIRTTAPAAACEAISREGADNDARTRLVNAAIASFTAKGFYGATTRDIAAAAGMSPAALYVPHKSKEDLLLYLEGGPRAHTVATARECRDL